MITTINTNPMRVVVVDADGQTMNDDALLVTPFVDSDSIVIQPAIPDFQESDSAADTLIKSNMILQALRNVHIIEE